MAVPIFLKLLLLIDIALSTSAQVLSSPTNAPNSAASKPAPSADPMRPGPTQAQAPPHPLASLRPVLEGATAPVRTGSDLAANSVPVSAALQHPNAVLFPFGRPFSAGESDRAVGFSSGTSNVGTGACIMCAGKG